MYCPDVNITGPALAVGAIQAIGRHGAQRRGSSTDAGDVSKPFDLMDSRLWLAFYQISVAVLE